MHANLIVTTLLSASNIQLWHYPENKQLVSLCILRPAGNAHKTVVTVTSCARLAILMKPLTVTYRARLAISMNHLTAIYDLPRDPPRPGSAEGRIDNREGSRGCARSQLEAQTGRASIVSSE